MVARSLALVTLIFLSFSSCLFALEPAGTFLKFERVEIYPGDDAIVVLHGAQIYDMVPHDIRLFDTDGVVTMALLYQAVTASMVDGMTAQTLEWDAIRGLPVEHWDKVSRAMTISVDKAVREYTHVVAKYGEEHRPALTGLTDLRAFFAKGVPTYEALDASLGVWLEAHARLHNYVHLFGDKTVAKGISVFDPENTYRNPVGDLSLSRGFRTNGPIMSKTRPSIDTDLNTLVQFPEALPEGLCPEFIAAGRHLDEAST